MKCAASRPRRKPVPDRKPSLLTRGRAMGVNVGVNKMSVVTKDSGGVTMAFPDVCKTPSPAGPIPIPYPNVAKSGDTDKGTKKVSVQGNPVCVKDSNFSTSTGD